MELTTTQLNYLLTCYSMVFSVIGLGLFMKASLDLKKMYDLAERIIELIVRQNKELFKHEGTDAD